MTDFYVDAARPDDNGDGLTWATAKQKIGSAITLATDDENGPHTINVCDGFYSQALSLNNANLVGITLQGESWDGTIAYSEAANTVFIGNAVTDGTLQRLTLQVQGAKNAVYKQASASGWTFEDMLFKSKPTHTSHLFRCYGGAGLSISRCRFQFQHSNNYPIYATGDTAGTISYCRFSAAGTSHFSNAVVISSTGNVACYNNVVLDTEKFGLSHSGSGTMAAMNNVIQGGSTGTDGACLRQGVGAGTFSAKRNVLISGTINSIGWISGDVTEGTGDDANIKTNRNPRFVRYSRGGAILPRIDDTPNLEYAQAVAAILKRFGFRGTWSVNQYNWSSGDTPALRELVRDGTMEIVSHGYTHTRMTTTGTVFTVTKGEETITTDRTADTITLSGGGTVSGFRAKTLGAIKTELEELGATVTPDGDNYGVGGIRAESLGEVFDDGTAVNTLEILHDSTAATGLEKVEIADAKALLTAEVNAAGDVTDGQTGETYVCHAFTFPYTDSDEGLRSAVRAAGYWGSFSCTDYAELTTLVDVDLYNVGGVGGPFAGEVDEATTRARARAIAFTAAQTGLVYSVLSHNTDGISLEQWEWICEEWQLFGDSIRVTSLQLLADEIVNSELWNDDEDGSYSRTYDQSDLHLKRGSPCIDAGADVGLSADLDGREVPLGAGVDIGAYECIGGIGEITGGIRVTPRITGGIRVTPRITGGIRV